MVENGSYYFKNINNKRKYDLDNLLITQGWSSYDWNKVNNPINYKFENGISIRVNVADNEQESNYLIHHLSHNDGNILSFKEEIKSFQLYSYFPEKNENLYISRLGKDNKLSQPSLYVQFFPNHIPKLKTPLKTLNSKAYYNNDEVLNTSYNFYNLKKVNTLKEIVVKANLKKQRIEKIKNQSFGTVHFLNDFDKYYTLAQFLEYKPGITASDDYQTGEFTASNKFRNSKVAVFLDGFLVLDSRILFNYSMFDVEYIEINLQDASGGLVYGPGGVIRIKTNPFLNKNKKKTVRKFNFPITFSTQKEFYIPKYKNYSSSFYKNYGVINWLPKNKINEDGTITIKIKNIQQKQVNLYLEGVTGDSKFISQKIKVNLK